MTPYYRECTVKGPFRDVFNVLSDYFGNVYARKLGKSGALRRGVVFGEEYFLRTTSAAAILIILGEQSSKKTKIQIVSAGGGAGLLGFSSGAHAAYVNKVKVVLSEAGFEVEKEKEITS